MFILFEEFHALFSVPYVTLQCNCRTRMSTLRAALVLMRFVLRTSRWRQTKMADPSFVLLNRYTCSAYMLKFCSNLFTVYIDGGVIETVL